MKLVVLHFKEKRLYPPLINMLSYLGENNIDFVLVGDYKAFKSKYTFINQLALYFNYLKFLIKGVFVLIKNGKAVLYYESLSVMPIVCYLSVFSKRKLRIFAHFHEYFSRQEYQRQSFLERTGRKYEQRIFKKAEWISHTNEDRLNLFKKDMDYEVDDNVLKTMPNYPSKTWASKNELVPVNGKDKIKLLHIGSLSLQGMYLKELLNAFGNNENFEIHFYSHIKNTELIDMLAQYTSVVFHGSIKYEDILGLRSKYDVGLVLYKGKSLNFKYNAPNKIFEYLALDLDVWCSEKLLTARHYIDSESFPKLIMVDFTDLESFDYKTAIDKSGLTYRKSPFFYEKVYDEFVRQLKDKNEEN